MSHKRFYLLPHRFRLLPFPFCLAPVFSFVLFCLLGCAPKDRPGNSVWIESSFPTDQQDGVEVVWTETWNLDETPEKEAIALLRRGSEEVLLVMSSTGEGGWKLNWKQIFSFREPSIYGYDSSKNQWVGLETEPEHTSKDYPKPGWIVQKVHPVTFPGDSFSSLVVEFLSEEPPLGLFSVPNVYRKGELVMNGLLLFKDTDELAKKKKIEVSQNPENKSLVINPKSPSAKFEMPFNGWEVVADIPGQTIASRLGWESNSIFEVGKESEVILHFKNRGSTSQVTFLSISFPQGEKVQILSQIPQAKVYNKGESIYNSTLGRYALAEYPLVEIARESWLRNGKFSLRLGITPNSAVPPKLFVRTANRIRKDDILLPSRYHSLPLDRDQQGFLAYSWILDDSTKTQAPAKNPPLPDPPPNALVNPKQ